MIIVESSRGKIVKGDGERVNGGRWKEREIPMA